MISDVRHLKEPVVSFLSSDFVVLRRDINISKALKQIRDSKVADKIAYFYVVDEQDKLVGVLPARRVLTHPLKTKLEEIMISNVVSIPATATAQEACDCFVHHKLLGFPVIDADGHVLGTVDLRMFTEQVFDSVERRHVDEVIQSLGMRVYQLKRAKPLSAFRFRFPWLLATIAGGALCALVMSAFQTTLAESIVLAFFLALVLGLGESLSMQAMTVAIHSLHSTASEKGWFRAALVRELVLALLMGMASGGIVTALIWVIWPSAHTSAIAIGLGIMLSACSAGVLGLAVPTALHAMKLDLRIAAGPVTLAIVDICTLLAYFGTAMLLLGT